MTQSMGLNAAGAAYHLREQPVNIVDVSTGTILCVVKAGPKTLIQHLKGELLEDTGIPAREQEISDGKYKYRELDSIGASMFKARIQKEEHPELQLRRLSLEEADALDARHSALERIKGGTHLKHLEEVHRDDAEVVMFAMEHTNASELQFAGASVTGDADIMLEALKLSTTSMYYISETLWSDRSFVKGAMCIDGQLLGASRVPKEWRSDVEVVLLACMNDGYALQFAAEELRKNRSIVLAAVSQRGTALMYASEELKGDYDVVLDAVRDNRMAIVHAKNGLRDDDDIRAAAGQGPSEKWNDKEKVDAIKKKFSELDVNGDGYLSYEELKTLLTKGNPDMKEDEIKLLYNELDSHSDGRVDFHEFCDFLFSG